MHWGTYLPTAWGGLGTTAPDSCTPYGFGASIYPCAKLPVQITSLSNIVTIGVGTYHALAVKADGSVVTWGINFSNNLGTGNSANALTPTAILGSNGSGTLNLIVSSSTGSTSDCLFSWAERNYAQYFSPAGATDGILAPYTYRYYSGTGNYLAVSSADNHIWVLGTVFGGLLDVGAVSGFLGPTTGCQ